MFGKKKKEKKTTGLSVILSQNVLELKNGYKGHTVKIWQCMHCLLHNAVGVSMVKRNFYFIFCHHQQLT